MDMRRHILVDMKNRTTILMAHLITALAISGACDGLGNPVSSGHAWFFEPGSTSTQKTVYSDPDGLSPLTQPVALDASGRATVYTNGAVRLQVEAADNSVVQTWDRANTCEASEVEVENAGYTGTVLSGNQTGSQAAGGRTDLNTVLTNLYASAGGIDGQYQIVNSAGTRVGTPRSLTKAITDISVNVKSFTTTNGLPVAGDGVQVDTTGIQAAINYVASLGGGIVYFPPGTYLVDQVINIASAPGVVLLGAGSGASIIKSSSTTLDVLYFNGSNGCAVRNLRVTTSSASSGNSIKNNGGLVFVVDGVKTDGSAYGLYLSSASSVSVIGGSNLTGSTTGIYNSTGAGLTVVASAMTGLTTSSSSLVSVVGSQGGVFVLDGGSQNITLVGNSITTLSFPSSVQPTNFYQYGNGIDGQALSSSAGVFGTIDLALGTDISLSAGQAAVTLPALTNPPPSTRRDYYVTIRFINAAGGAVTWTTNAQFKLNTTIPTTDAHTILVRFLWDGATSKFREISRADTTT